MLKLINFVTQQWIVLTLSILFSITLLSLWPMDELPEVPGSDKTHHLIAYSALMFPTALKRPKSWLLIALCFTAYSGGIELVQPYVNRYGEWLDMVANTTGVLLGMALAELVRRFILRAE